MIFGESRVDIARRIVERHQAEEIDGVLVDAFSASAYVQVYDALARPENRAQMERYKFPFVMDRVVWPIINKVRGA